MARSVRIEFPGAFYHVMTAGKLNIPTPDQQGAAGSQTISYDANGNRAAFGAYGTTDIYTTNELNQYSSRNSTNATYDANGNLIVGVDASFYSYDAQNRLLSDAKGGTTETFTYDGLNRQVSRTINHAITYNVYDGWDLIGEYASGANTPTAAYVGGAGGLVKNLVTNRYYYQDASGSTSHLADSSGNLLEWYRYDLQGTPIFYNAGNTQILSSNYGVRHLFTGQQWYSELGLYDLRNRYYSPDIGRFLQVDPMGFNGDATNLYRYCGNNPLKWRDPTGLGIFRFLMDLFGVGNNTATAERVTVTGSDPNQNGNAGGDNSGGDNSGGDNSGGDSPGLGFAPGEFGPGGFGLGGEPGIGPGFNIRTGVPIPPPAPILPPVTLPPPPSTVPFASVSLSAAPATSITVAYGPGAGLQITVTYDQYGQTFLSLGGQIGKSWPVSFAMTSNSVIGQSNPSASQIASSMTGLGWSASGGVYYFGGQLSGPASWWIFTPFSNNAAGPPSNWGAGIVTPQFGLGVGYTWQGPTLAKPLPPYNSPGGL